MSGVMRTGKVLETLQPAATPNLTDGLSPLHEEPDRLPGAWLLESTPTLALARGYGEGRGIYPGLPRLALSGQPCLDKPKCWGEGA